MELSPADEKRATDLRHMRRVATGLLVLAAVIYLATLPWADGGWQGWVNAGSEAAMVGALADWFAVTAIFRHPLGVPVPHTALVKRRKDELGRSLQDFVTNNFLTVDILQDKLREAELPHRAAVWLSSHDNRTRAVSQLARGVRALVDRVEDRDVEGMVNETVLPRLVDEPVSPAAGRLLADAVANGAHEPTVEALAREAHEWLRHNPDKARDVIGERAPSWSPRWLDRTVVDFGYQQALEWTMAVRMQKHHPARIALTNFLNRLAEDLQHDETVMAKAESIKQAALASESIAPTAVELWHSLRSTLLDSLDNPDSPLWRRLDRWLADFAVQLGSDEQLRSRVEARLSDVVTFLVETYGTELASVISTTVDRWDADEASDRIELFVGRDLQFIRINGTVVGCLAGLAIHGLSLVVQSV